MKKHTGIKRILTMLAVAAATVVFAVAASAEQASVDFAVNFTLPNGFEYGVKAFEKEKTATDENGVQTYMGKEYTLVLPYVLENKEVSLLVSAEADVIMDGRQLSDNTLTVLGRGVHQFECGGTTGYLNVMYTSDVPQIYIDTQQPLSYIHEDKENETAGSMVITDGTEIYYSGGMETLKGRGNVSWNADKKPYSIKLSQKVSLFGMEPSRKYNLLANFIDEAIIRNKVTIDFAEKAGVEYCTQSQFAELYINNEYLGIYQLTEKVEVADGRVEIFDVDIITEESNRGTDLENLPQGGEYGKDAYKKKGSCKWLEVPNDIAKGIDGGYLIELDLFERYSAAKTGFVSNYGQIVTVRSPEYASEAQVKYISGYYQEFEDAVLNADGYNSLGRHYTEYIDMESMARMYIVQEFVQNLDAALTSAFLYKDVNGKLAMCSPWDFDHALGDEVSDADRNISNPENIWVAKGTLYNQKNTYTIFSLLWQHPEFRREAARQWKEVFRPQIEWLSDMQQDVADSIYDSAVADYYRWRRTAYIDNVQAAQLYLDEIEKMADYIEKRAEFLDKFLSEDAVYVKYGANGGSEFVSDKNSYMPGDTVVVRYCDYENEDELGGIEFIGWNTKADGSGTEYRPEDTFVITEDVTLYAQWARQNQQNKPVQTTVEDIGLFDSILNWFKNLFK